MDYVRSRDPARYTRTAQEEAIMRGWLNRLTQGCLVFDCPCGTGRFVQTAVDLGLRYVGGNVSEAMIKEAQQISKSSPNTGVHLRRRRAVATPGRVGKPRGALAAAASHSRRNDPAAHVARGRARVTPGRAGVFSSPGQLHVPAPAGETLFHR